MQHYLRSARAILSVTGAVAVPVIAIAGCSSGGSLQGFRTVEEGDSSACGECGGGFGSTGDASDGATIDALADAESAPDASDAALDVEAGGPPSPPEMPA